jgi:hypothetical protein
LRRATGDRAGIALAFELIESAQHRWRAVNSAHLVALGAKFKNGVLVDDPTNQQAVTLTRMTR